MRRWRYFYSRPRVEGRPACSPVMAVKPWGEHIVQNQLCPLFSKQDFGENALLLFALACDTLFLTRMSSAIALGNCTPMERSWRMSSFLTLSALLCYVKIKIGKILRQFALGVNHGGGILLNTHYRVL